MNRPSFFLLISLLLAPASLSAEQLFDNGVPGLTDGSELTGWREADRFTVTQSVVLGSVRYWDLQAAPNAFFGSVLWEIRAHSASNTPGALLYTGLATNPSRIATGRVAFVFAPEFVVTFDVPSLSLPPGTYWLVLHNGPLTYNGPRDLYWEEAINVGDPSLRDPVPYLSDWRSNGVVSKLAFQLYGVPEMFRARIISVDRSSGAPRVTFTTAAGQSYRVEYKNTLTENAWTTVPGAENVPGTGGAVEVSDPDPTAPSLRHRFYRVTLHTAPPPSAFVPAVWARQVPEAAELLSSEVAPPNSLRARRPPYRLAQ